MLCQELRLTHPGRYCVFMKLFSLKEDVYKRQGDKRRNFGKKLSAKVIDGVEIEDIVPEMFQ